MKNTKKTFYVEYKESRRHRKMQTAEIVAKNEVKAEEIFLKDYPEAVPVAILPKETWNEVTIRHIKEIEYEAERMKYCYFWGGEGNRQHRDWYEKKHSVAEVEWWEDGHHYSASFDVECHYSYTKATGYYMKDGEWTTLTAIRNSRKRMEAEIEAAKAELLEAAGK